MTASQLFYPGETSCHDLMEYALHANFTIPTIILLSTHHHQ